MFTYNPKNNLLANKNILITGAGDGIGKAAALHFSKYQANVILLGKTVNKLEKTYDEIKKINPQLKPSIIPLDLQGATEEHYQDLQATIKDQYGQLDGLLNNAAILGTITPLEQIKQTEFEKVLHVNVTAQFLLTKQMLPLLKASAFASILFTSSGVGKKGRAFWGTYAISKFATEGMMQVLADELENSNIRVNSINPGATRTKMRQLAFPNEDSNTLQTAADIMPVYLYLISNQDQNIHGQAIDAKDFKLD